MVPGRLKPFALTKFAQSIVRAKLAKACATGHHNPVTLFCHHGAANKENLMSEALNEQVVQRWLQVTRTYFAEKPISASPETRASKKSEPIASRLRAQESLPCMSCAGYS
jgi:hypothetical protein